MITLFQMLAVIFICIGPAALVRRFRPSRRRRVIAFYLNLLGFIVAVALVALGERQPKEWVVVSTTGIVADQSGSLLSNDANFHTIYHTADGQWHAVDGPIATGTPPRVLVLHGRSRDPRWRCLDDYSKTVKLVLVPVGTVIPLAGEVVGHDE